MHKAFHCTHFACAHAWFATCRLNCWLFHQMLHMYRPPPPVSVASRDPRVDASFFHRTTVLPLYQLLKRMSKPELEVPDAWRAYVFMCCRKRGSKRLVKNSARPNYDDMNEVRGC
ncbi:hypothetical protein EON66_03305 [archaeon]|nr:MAG: hypothetical protein EON66_03305 [archaeon]